MISNSSPTIHDGRKREALAPDHSGDEETHCNPNHVGTPHEEAAQESGPLLREHQRRNDSGHEEEEGVEQGESAKAAGGLLEQIERETQRASAGGRIACRVHEGDLMVYRGHHLR